MRRWPRVPRASVSALRKGWRLIHHIYGGPAKGVGGRVMGEGTGGQPASRLNHVELCGDGQATTPLWGRLTGL